MCLKSRKSYFSFYSMIHLSKWDPWHTLKFIAFPQSGRDVGIMINRWGVLIILISSLCSLWKWVAEGTNEQAILKEIKTWFQVSPLLLLSYINFQCSPSSFVLLCQCNGTGAPAVLSSHFWLLLLCCTASPTEEGRSSLPLEGWVRNRENRFCHLLPDLLLWVQVFLHRVINHKCQPFKSFLQVVSQLFCALCQPCFPFPFLESALLHSSLFLRPWGISQVVCIWNRLPCVVSVV